MGGACVRKELCVVRMPKLPPVVEFGGLFVLCFVLSRTILQNCFLEKSS